MALRTSNVLLPHILELLGIEVKVEGVGVDLFKWVSCFGNEKGRFQESRFDSGTNINFVNKQTNKKLCMIHLPHPCPQFLKVSCVCQFWTSASVLGQCRKTCDKCNKFYDEII